MSPPPSESLFSATLVAGPDDASLTYANSAAGLTIGQVCTFSTEPSSSFAVCQIAAAGSTVTQTEFVSFVPVQVTGPLSSPSLTASSSISASLTSEMTATRTAASTETGPTPLQTNDSVVARTCAFVLLISWCMILASLVACFSVF